MSVQLCVNIRDCMYILSVCAYMCTHRYVHMCVAINVLRFENFPYHLLMLMFKILHSSQYMMSVLFIECQQSYSYIVPQIFTINVSKVCFVLLNLYIPL